MNCSGFGIRSSGFGRHVPQIAADHWSPRSAAFSGPRVALAIVAVIAALACSSESGSKPATPFPEANEVPGWSRAGEMRTFQADNLWEYIDGDADRYVQAGVEKTLTVDYRYQDRIEATADIYIMKGADGARKIFESESSVDSRPVRLGDAARLFQSSLVFRKERYFVRLTAFQEAPEVGKALADLGRAIERKLGQR